jgi:hypothetical protein
VLCLSLPVSLLLLSARPERERERDDQRIAWVFLDWKIERR